MTDVDEQPAGADATEQSEATRTHARSERFATQSQPSDEEMRAAYEAELNRITSSEMILQTTVSLLNIGGRRLGLGAPAESAGAASLAAGERDLDQVRDAIDGARALMPILERHMAGELGPLRDAIAQLQMAYAREVQGAQGTSGSTTTETPTAIKPKPTEPTREMPSEDDSSAPGPAQASGRLWVPGR